jgi:hypothetical protein
MNRNHIIQCIGTTVYAEACQLAFTIAEDPYYGRRLDPITSDIPHAISTIVTESTLSPVEQTHILLDVYEDMPFYALLMYVKWGYSTLSPPQKEIFWGRIVTILLKDTKAFTNTLMYALWVDFFEDGKTVHEAWAALTNPPPSDQVLENILIHAGPVPFSLKLPVYQSLIQHTQWHYPIFHSLLHSAFDAYGSIDKQAALRIFENLQIQETTEHRTRLQAFLLSE